MLITFTFLSGASNSHYIICKAFFLYRAFFCLVRRPFMFHVPIFRVQLCFLCCKPLNPSDWYFLLLDTSVESRLLLLLMMIMMWWWWWQGDEYSGQQKVIIFYFVCKMYRSKHLFNICALHLLNICCYLTLYILITQLNKMYFDSTSLHSLFGTIEN